MLAFQLENLYFALKIQLFFLNLSEFSKNFQDSSTIVESLITSYQRGLMETVFEADSINREKCIQVENFKLNLF